MCIRDRDSKGQLVGVYKNIKEYYLKSQMYLEGNLNYELTDEYSEGYIYDIYNQNYSSGKGYKFISGGSLESGYETMSLLHHNYRMFLKEQIMEVGYQL